MNDDAEDLDRKLSGWLIERLADTLFAAFPANSSLLLWISAGEAEAIPPHIG